jgi:hypothetical protein
MSEMGIDRLHRWGHVGNSTKMYEFHVVRKLNLILWGYMSIPNLKVTLGISLKIEEYYAKHPGITISRDTTLQSVQGPAWSS